MSTELVTIQSQKEYAEILSASNLLPRAYQKQPANVFTAMAMGEALGLKPIEAINSINVIQGKPALSAELMGAMVRRAGHKLRITCTKNPPTATATLIRKDDPDAPFTVTWDEKAATRAGLWMSSPSWQKYPDQMMRARAITEVCRMGAADALSGLVYTAEELGRDDAIPGDAPIVETIVVDEDEELDTEPEPVDGETRNERQEIAEYIRERLQAKGVVLATELTKECINVFGVSDKTVRRAFNQSGAKRCWIEGVPPKVVWYLPEMFSSEKQLKRYLADNAVLADPDAVEVEIVEEPAQETETAPVSDETPQMVDTATGEITAPENSQQPPEQGSPEDRDYQMAKVREYQQLLNISEEQMQTAAVWAMRGDAPGGEWTSWPARALEAVWRGFREQAIERKLAKEGE